MGSVGFTLSRLFRKFKNSEELEDRAVQNKKAGQCRTRRQDSVEQDDRGVQSKDTGQCRARRQSRG